MDEATFVSAGLYDPDAPGAAERLELLEYLVGLGATIEDLEAAHGTGALQRIVIELVRRGDGPVLSPREIAARAGVGLDVVERVSRAGGLPIVDPDQPIFREGDADAFALFDQGAAIFGDGPTLEFTRTIGAAMASVADSAMAVFGIGAASRFDEGGLSEVERAQVSELASFTLHAPHGVIRIIDVLFFHHVGAAVRRSVAARSGDARTATYAVGFVDLVASTVLSHRLDPAGLTDAIGWFERTATEIVTGRGGRVVKTIGDEIMFVNADPIAACDTALALRDAVLADERLGTVRGGLAYGELALGYGDFYGTEVNLAARLVRAAEPGQVLAADSLVGPASGRPDLGFTVLDDIAVPGFDEPVRVASVERLPPT